MTVAARIRDEARRYAADVAGGSDTAAAIYSFGIEMGMAIAVQAGSDARELLGSFRAAVYHDTDADRAVHDEMDRAAAAIVREDGS